MSEESTSSCNLEVKVAHTTDAHDSTAGETPKKAPEGCPFSGKVDNACTLPTKSGESCCPVSKSCGISGKSEGSCTLPTKTDESCSLASKLQESCSLGKTGGTCPSKASETCILKKEDACTLKTSETCCPKNGETCTLEKSTKDEPAKEASTADSQGHDEEAPPEEEVVEGNWKARKVEVSEIKVETGEEDEDVFWTQRSKLYRWATDTDGTGVWKERGLGDSKLLKHKTTGKIRFLLRQEKTFKVVANHYVLESDGLCKLTPNVGSDKIWVWTAHNTLEDENKVEQLALKFATLEQAKLFKEKFEEAAALNKELFKK